MCVYVYFGQTFAWAANEISRTSLDSELFYLKNKNASTFRMSQQRHQFNAELPNELNIISRAYLLYGWNI